MQRTGTGIGPALRKARLHRGKSLQEASRETRIRVDYLEALEREEFEALLGDVYVRGFLRTYSAYLGLSPEKVLTAYEGRFGAPVPADPAPPVRPGIAPRGLLQEPHPRRTRLIAVGGAIVLLAVAGALGLLSRSRSGPEAADAPVAVPASIEAVAPGVTLALVALEEVYARVEADGVEAFAGVLREGEARSFSAAREIRLELERGRTVELTVNGRELGRPGTSFEPYEGSFGAEDFGGAPEPLEGMEEPASPGRPSPGGSGSEEPQPSPSSA